MPKKLVRRGRVKSYRPTREQLQELLELAQRGIDNEDSIAHLTYSQGDLEISGLDGISRILPDHLADLIREAGDPDELNNLEFSIDQDSPVRRVEISIGPGNWTTYRVESDDQTWAFGRYHELTDRLLLDRATYAKGKSPRPEVLQEGRDDKWRRAAWEPVTGWRTSIAIAVPGLAAVLPVVGLGLLLIYILNYYLPPGKTKAGERSHQQAVQALHWVGANRPVLIGLTLSYLIGLFAWRRWLRSLLKSVVVLRKASLLAQFSFQDEKSDSVVLASFYVSFLTLIATVLALLIR